MTCSRNEFASYSGHIILAFGFQSSLFSTHNKNGPSSVKQANILHCTVLLSKCEILDFAEFSTDLNKDLGISMNSHDESA